MRLLAVSALLVLLLSATAHSLRAEDEDPVDLDVDAEPVAAESRVEVLESELAQAVVAFQDQRDGTAETHFRNALAYDPNNMTALEHLIVIYERRGDYAGAAGWAKRAVEVSPEPRRGYLEYHLGRLLMQMDRLDDAEPHFRVAAESAPEREAIRSMYVLGYIEYKRGNYRNAQWFLAEAKEGLLEQAAHPHPRAGQASTVGSGAKKGAADLGLIARQKPIVPLVPGAIRALPEERTTLQAINYYLGEIYARYHYVRYASALLHLAEFGESRDIRTSAWQIHSELNRPRSYALLGLFTRADSRLTVTELDSDILLGEQKSPAVAALVVGRGGWQSSPVKKWSYGFDGAGQQSHYFNRKYRLYDTSLFGISGWGEFWNGKNTTVTLRYDLSNAYRNGISYVGYETLHGPTLNVNYFPYQRWNWEAGVYFHQTSFSSDQQERWEERSADILGAYGKITLRSFSDDVKPNFKYGYEKGSAIDPRYSFKSHLVELGFDFDLSDKLRAILSGQGRYTIFPLGSPKRIDRLVRGKLGFQRAIDAHWSINSELLALRDLATIESFQYWRADLTLGVTYLF